VRRQRSSLTVQIQPLFSRSILLVHSALHPNLEFFTRG
jgi:hypothetical protein